MKKNIVIILILSIVLLYPVIGFSSSDLDEDDPLITLSYLEYRLNEISNNIADELPKEESSLKELGEIVARQEEEIKKILDNVNNSSNNTNNLEIVELKENQKIILKAGSQIILRAGEAYAITSELGGLSDVTSGVDIKENETIPLNHQLIIPRSDGRGVYVNSYGIFMVNGSYEVVDF